MLCLCKDTEFPEFLVKVFHISSNSCLDCTEVMVVKFLSFRSFCTEKCSACINKILSLIVSVLINKEVFLLRTYCCCNSCNIFFAEKMKNLYSLCIYSLH